MRTRSSRPGAAIPFLALVGLACAVALIVSGCGGGGLANGGSGVPAGSGAGGGGVAPTAAGFEVLSSAGYPVAGATVFLIPAGMVNDQPITAADILSGAAANRDEPLEDVVRNQGASLPQAVTDASGMAMIPTVAPGDYFFFAQPAVGDTEHLPGGDVSRRSREDITFVGLTSTITLSTQPGATAAHLGSTTCLFCHNDLSDIAGHAHRLALTTPGSFGMQQDPTDYPGIQAGWNRFPDAGVPTGGTAVWFSDYDATRGADKFTATLSDPSLSGGPAPVVQAWLWRDTADQRYKITLVNLANPGDPRTPWTLPVALTYGGAKHRQTYLLEVSGRDGLYPFLSFQLEGDETIFARERKTYRDFALETFFDPGSSLFVDPGMDRAFQGNCTGCHSTGFERVQAGSGEWLSTATNDFNGIYDIDGDGETDEINVGCESCHGPGSDHVAWASSGSSAGHRRRYIVQPRLLSPSRALTVCGRCHDRPLGNGPMVTGEPLDQNGRRALPGISRHDFLAQFTTRAGPDASDYWDGIHTRRDQQHVSDLIKSTMHRNDRIVTVCSDCHGAHGGSFRNQLVEDPDDPDSPLCATCHSNDFGPHVSASTGFGHTATAATCADCHMPRTGTAGAGRYGLLLGTPTGAPTDRDLVYFQGDIASHFFGAVPRKTHPQTAGMPPAIAMPIPYTESCGAACHDASGIPNLIPIPALPAPAPSSARSTAMADCPSLSEEKR